MQAAKDVPLKVGQYIGMFILSSLGIIGFILLLVWAFSGDTNTNKKNFARAMLIMQLIVGLVFALFAILFGTVFLPLISDFINELTSGGQLF